MTLRIRFEWSGGYGVVCKVEMDAYKDMAKWEVVNAKVKELLKAAETYEPKKPEG